MLCGAVLCSLSVQLFYLRPEVAWGDGEPLAIGQLSVQTDSTCLIRNKNDNRAEATKIFKTNRRTKLHFVRKEGKQSIAKKARKLAMDGIVMKRVTL